jgi:hypothetical protein
MKDVRGWQAKRTEEEHFTRSQLTWATGWALAADRKEYRPSTFYLASWIALLPHFWLVTAVILFFAYYISLQCLTNVAGAPQRVCIVAKNSCVFGSRKITIIPFAI